uniref:Uncharacterized protein n=1 Tax=Anguilla anguilla TaxID=7936 RepID=A0A0E9VSC1_ANGAN
MWLCRIPFPFIKLFLGK